MPFSVSKPRRGHPVLDPVGILQAELELVGQQHVQRLARLPGPAQGGGGRGWIQRAVSVRATAPDHAPGPPDWSAASGTVWLPGRREQHRPDTDRGRRVGHEDIDPAVDHAALVARDPVGAVDALPRAQVVPPEMTRAGQYAVADQATGQGGMAMGAGVRDGDG